MASKLVNIATAAFLLQLFLVFACFPSSPVALKEEAEDLSPSEYSSLALEIIKRLGVSSKLADSPKVKDEGEDVAELDRLKQSQCEYNVKQESIIKASDSLKNGASYVDSISGTKSNAECQEHCCKNASCDVAVYQDKEDRFCYLFQCKGSCVFKEHAGYFVNSLEHRTAGGSGGSETELQSLSGGMGGPTPALPASVSSSVSGGDSRQAGGGGFDSAPASQQPLISQHSVSLAGFCTQDNQCEDTNAACQGNNCRCRQGFYSKDGICRMVCANSDFECYELGTITHGPECVPKEQVCDSYMQCADGSDEFNCDAINNYTSDSLEGKGNSKVQETDHSSKNRHESGKTGSVKAPLPDKLPSESQPSVDHETSDSQSGSASANSVEEANSHSSKVSGNMNTGNSSAHHTAVVSSSPAPIHQPSNSGDGGAKHVFVASREKVIIAGTGDAMGPIIALSLGLALTLVLLVMVVCRLRGMRHRLRKGRPLNQNEADYLINGMYL